MLVAPSAKGADTRFRLLGPLELEIGQSSVLVPEGRQCAVLALLLLEEGTIVPTDLIIDTVWDYDPPETARTQVQICVSRLRRLLLPTGVTLETVAPGYRLVLGGAATTDVTQLRRALEQAGELLGADRAADAARLLRDAVEVRRGPALTGVRSQVLKLRAEALDAEALDAVELLLRVELGLGRHARLVGELTTLVEGYPFRERLRGHLMLALYRCGRQAEALDVYRSGRRHLVGELGLEPGEELRALEKAILAGDASLDLPGAGSPGRPEGDSPGEVTIRPSTGTASLPTPYHLPPSTSDFVGRRRCLRDVTRLLLDSSGATPVAILLGPPGVGKSAIAIEVAHRLAEANFPDGQLYCDLRGSRSRPLPATDVLGRFLRAMGVPGGAIPTHVDERATMLRGLLATKRMLIVLDDAAREGQVEPLIPGSTSCAVIVTSRTNLTGLSGAAVLTVGVLPTSSSLDLLRRRLGARRVGAEIESATALVEAVGHLPLALHILAARLAARPGWSLATMVDRVSDESRRLDVLEHGDITVRASLSLSCVGLAPVHAHVFALLGLLENTTIPGWVVGALVDDHREHPSDLVDSLVDAHLLATVGSGPGGEPTYRFHELIRVYARERMVDQTSGAARSAALTRVAGAWLVLLESANRRLLGGKHDLQIRGSSPRWLPPQATVDRLTQEPNEWLESERGNLRLLISQVANEGLHEQCWELVLGFALFLERRAYWDILAEVRAIASSAAREHQNRLGEAALSLVTSRGSRSPADPAEEYVTLSSALSEFAALDHSLGEALAQRRLAYLDYRNGDAATATWRCEAALAGFAREGDQSGQRRCLTLLGYLRARNGDIVRGLADLNWALSLAERAADPRAVAQVLRRLAQVDVARGHPMQAETRIRRALALVAEANDPLGSQLLVRDLALVDRSEAGVDTDAAE